MAIGNGKETYSYSTLKSMRKEQLINVIRCLESNLINANKSLDNQAKNCKELMQDEYERGYMDGRDKGYYDGEYIGKRTAFDETIDDVFEYLKTKRDKRYMKVNLDDLEIRQYKEHLVNSKVWVIWDEK